MVIFLQTLQVHITEKNDLKNFLKKNTGGPDLTDPGDSSQAGPTALPRAREEKKKLYT
jgi:hypothetical protein